MNATTGHRTSRTGWRSLVVLLFFALVGGVLLSAEHRAHALGLLPWLLILLICPLMHMFMHGSHGGHGDEHEHEDDAGRHGHAASEHRH